jgi:hypothetical protein
MQTTGTHHMLCCTTLTAATNSLWSVLHCCLLSTPQDGRQITVSCHQCQNQHVRCVCHHFLARVPAHQQAEVAAAALPGGFYDLSGTSLQHPSFCDK